jgi:RNA polymerase sigma-70 factor, ECF subfamily
MEIRPTDESLMERIKQGDSASLDRLFKSYYQPVCSILYYLTNDKGRAEELGADVFMKLWEKRESIIITESVKSYLFAMAHNAGLAELRKKKQSFIEIDAANSSDPLAATTQNPEQELISRQSTQLLTDVINSISDQSRIIFSLSRDEGLKYREIAQLLGIPEKTVEHHMGKALKFLREKLKNH